MGCSSSTSAQSPSGNDGEFQKEVNGKRVRFDKKTGKAVAVTGPKEKPETDFFEAQEAGKGEQFMAVKPWIGAVIEPASHNPHNPSAPDVSYNLEYVYGYRCADSRQNVFFNANGEAVYMTAALGVILNFGSNTQKFFGGGQVANTAKNVANDENCHTDDIMALQVSNDRRTVVSGQVGPSPACFVWDAVTGQKKARAKLAKGARGVNAIAISGDNSLFAVVDLNDNHNVYLFDTATGQMRGTDKGDTNKIFDVAFSNKPGDNSFCTVGSKHIKFWDVNCKQQKGIFGGKGEATSFACVAYDDKGTAYSGAVNSQIYVWPTNQLAQTIPAHKGGFICALRWAAGKLYSGGKDGNIVITNTTSLTVENTISFDGVLIRAIDINGGQGLVGCRDGTIYSWEVGTNNKKPIMRGHSDGEVWGLALGDDSTVITSGDDNKIHAWNVDSRTIKTKATISTTNRKAPKGGASSLTDLPDSQCARALAYNPHNGHVAVGHNDGTLTVRALSSLDSVAFTNQNSQEWIEAMEYSPDGTKLAVGSHDNNIYVYDASNYQLLGKCTAHKSFIVSVDWSVDGKFIRSCCGAHELLFHSGETYKQDPSGATNTKETVWATGHAKFGWLVDGIFPSGTDGTHINGVNFSKDGQLIATGDDYGLVNIFRNPCRIGSTPICLRGHSEHVVRVAFHKNDSYLFSVGGYDQTLMQFKRA